MTVTIPAYTTVYGAATLQLRLGDGDHRAPGLGRRRQEVERDVLGRGRRQCNYTCRFIRSGCGLQGSPYTVTPIMSGKPIGNYTVTINTGTDTITPAPAGIAITAAKTSVANTTAGLAVCHLHDRAQLPGHGGQGNTYGYGLCLRLLCPNHIDCLRPNPNVRDLPSHKWRYHLADNSYLRRANRSNSSMRDRTNQHCLHSLQHSGDAYPLGQAASLCPTTEATTTGTHYLSFVYSGDAGTNGDSQGRLRLLGGLGNWQPHPARRRVRFRSR